jgi:hypothetical protein
MGKKRKEGGRIIVYAYYNLKALIDRYGSHTAVIYSSDPRLSLKIYLRSRTISKLARNITRSQRRL